VEGSLAAARFTFLRAVREPALAVTVGASVLLLLLAPAGTALGFHEEESLVRDIGLSTLLLGGILVAMVTGIGGDGRTAAARLLVLRPPGRGGFYAGSFAGSLGAALMVNAAIALCAVILLRHRAVAFADEPAFLMVGAVMAGAVAWGAVRNFRTGRSFVGGALAAAFLLGLVGAGAALFWAPRGGLRVALSSEDVMLLQAVLLCFFTAAAAFTAVWAGSAILGRTGGMAAGWAVVVLGVVRESFGAAPLVLRAPLGVLVPNLGLVWSGDLFYADLDTLPWTFVGAGCLHLAAWSAGAALLGLAATLCRRNDSAAARRLG
jgi:hypothetical protein